MNIMKMATGALTPILASKLAGSLGVPEGLVRKVLSVGLPAVLAMFMKRGATQEGADALSAAMTDLPSNPLSALGELLSGGDDKVKAAGKSGSDMLSAVLGGPMSSSFVDKIAGYVGSDKSSVGSMLGIVGAGALGTLKATADERRLDTEGVLKLLSSQKDELANAIPSDLAESLSGAGLLPDGFQTTVASATDTAQAKSSGGVIKWVIGAAAALLLLWIVPQFFGSTGDTNPMMIDGVNVGETLTGTLASVTDALAGVTDAESAQSALESLTAAGMSLSEIQSAFGSMNQEGQSAISTIIAENLPGMQSTVENLLGNSEISAILKPVLDSIISTLRSMAG